MMDMNEVNTKRKTARSGSETMFPGRLYDLLEYVESQGLDYIVSWVRDGTAFMVHKPDELLQLLSFFFGQTKYRSFTRQLNMWFFEREDFGPYKGSFSHPYFQKGNRELCSLMSRHENPRNRPVSSSNEVLVAARTPAMLGSSIEALGKDNDETCSPLHEHNVNSAMNPTSKPLLGDPSDAFFCMPDGGKLGGDDMPHMTQLLTQLVSRSMSPFREENSLTGFVRAFSDNSSQGASTADSTTSRDVRQGGTISSRKDDTESLFNMSMNLDDSLFHLCGALEPIPIQEPHTPPSEMITIESSQFGNDMMAEPASPETVARMFQEFSGMF
jgi:hypothetical protein